MSSSDALPLQPVSDGSGRRLALAAGLAVGLAGACATLALTEQPDWAIPTGPAQLLTLTFHAMLAWALCSPWILSSSRLGPWLLSGLLGACAFVPLIVAGSRLAFAAPLTVVLIAARLAGIWLASSGALALLSRWTRRPLAHHQAIIAAICVVPPLVDFAAIELLGAARLFGPSFSPVEWLAWADLSAPLAIGGAVWPTAVLAVLGAGAVWFARRNEEE